MPVWGQVAWGAEMASIINRAGASVSAGAWPLLAAFLCFILFPSVGFASAWLEPQGHTQLITTLTYHTSSGRFDDKGNPVVPEYRRIELAPYAEYGLTDWLTLGAQPRHLWASSGSGALRQTSQGLGDMDVFARAPLANLGPWVTSVQGTAILGEAYNKARRPAPGTSENAYEFRVLAGRNLSRSSESYINLETGYRLGQAGVADQFRFDASLGFKRRRRWLFLEELFLTKSIGTGDGVPGHAYDLGKLQTSFVYSLSAHLGLQIGFERDIAGSGVSLGNTGLFALWAGF